MHFYLRSGSFTRMRQVIDCWQPGFYYCALILTMVLTRDDIRNDRLVTDIVIQDYRTSAVFRKYGIDYCCGGKMPLHVACEMRGLDPDVIKQELINALRNIQVSNSTNFNNWSVDFLVEYIVNVHHAYLVSNFPDIV